MLLFDAGVSSGTFLRSTRPVLGKCSSDRAAEQRKAEEADFPASAGQPVPSPKQGPRVMRTLEEKIPHGWSRVGCIPVVPEGSGLSVRWHVRTPELLPARPGDAAGLSYGPDVQPQTPTVSADGFTEVACSGRGGSAGSLAVEGRCRGRWGMVSATAGPIRPLARHHRSADCPSHSGLTAKRHQRAYRQTTGC